MVYEGVWGCHGGINRVIRDAVMHPVVIILTCLSTVVQMGVFSFFISQVFLLREEEGTPP
jgi:uncharacterized membrane protein YvlD (DUF360 family)